MNPGGATKLALANLRRDRKAALLGAAGVSLGVGLLVLFATVGAGVTTFVRERLLPVDAQLVVVVPPKVALGLFGERTLDEAAVTHLSEIPGVFAAFRRMDVRTSAVSRFDGDFFGQRLRMGVEILASGVDPVFLESGLARGKGFAATADGPIPVMLSTRLLDIYNGAFARQRGLPTLTPALLTGFQFPIEFGRSFVSPIDGPVLPRTGELVGFHAGVPLAGVAIPLEVAKALNAALGKDATHYSAVLLRADRLDDVPSIEATVHQLGWDVDTTDRDLARQVALGVRVVTWVLALLALLVSGLAAVAIAQMFQAAVRERRREIGVLRAVGATRRDVLRILLTEAAVIGLVGGVVGVGLGAVGALGVEWAVRKLPSGLPLGDGAIVTIQLEYLGLGLVVGVVAALLGAWGPARRAARMAPARALAE